MLIELDIEYTITFISLLGEITLFR